MCDNLVGDPLKDFSVVFFTSEKRFSVVPSSWLSEDRRFCFWPGAKVHNKSNLIRTANSQPDPSWKRLLIDFVKSYRKLIMHYFTEYFSACHLILILHCPLAYNFNYFTGSHDKAEQKSETLKSSNTLVIDSSECEERKGRRKVAESVERPPLPTSGFPSTILLALFQYKNIFRHLIKLFSFHYRFESILLSWLRSGSAWWKYRKPAVNNRAEWPFHPGSKYEVWRIGKEIW